MSNITIRNVEPVINKQISEMAKAQGLSKEEFLRRKLKEMTIIDVRNEEIDKYRNLVDMAVNVIEINNKVLERILSYYEK